MISFKKKMKFNDRMNTILSGQIIKVTYTLEANKPTISIMYLDKRTELTRYEILAYYQQTTMHKDYARLLKANYMY